MHTVGTHTCIELRQEGHDFHYLLIYVDNVHDIYAIRRTHTWCVNVVFFVCFFNACPQKHVLRSPAWAQRRKVLLFNRDELRSFPEASVRSPEKHQFLGNAYVLVNAYRPVVLG